MNGNYEKKTNNCGCLQFNDGACYRGFRSSCFELPLLAIFVKAQKTDLIVRKSLGTIMKNYTQLLDYLLLPFKNKLQMSDFPTSPSAARHFMSVNYCLN